MQFDQALRYLLDLGHETLAIKLGLRNIELLLTSLGHPQNSYPCLQIAGTNGKGSTAVVLDSICAAAGIKSGLFTSPHLISITERVRVGGKEISRESFARQATVVRDAAETLLAEKQIEALPTFFEQVTAIALAEFRNAEVELAILETGLGGRLDATTAARADVVAITAIGLDHQQYLGETLEQIAAEKAAIIRPGVKAIIGWQPAAAMNVILRFCKNNGVEPSLADCRTVVEGVTPDGRLRASFKTQKDLYEHVLVGLRGRHQLENVSLAVRLAEALGERGFPISRSAIVAGIENARHAGRLELWPGHPAVLFDGAHNPDGVQALREYFDEFITVPVTLIFGAMEDKNLEQMGEALFPAATRLVLTQLDNPRAATLETLERVAAQFVDSKRIRSASSVEDAIRIAKEMTPSDELICVTGSLYLIGEVQSQLKQEQDVGYAERES
ncbi:MAG: bifunctional folylpolyglutamate synthase/dihydrofolate synthase [Pyrinomonadaceae bacterium]